MKCCAICHTSYPLAAFYRNATKPDGLQNRCKECVKYYDQKRIATGVSKARLKIYYSHVKATERYQTARRSKGRSYRQAHPEQLSAKGKRHYQRNKEQYFQRNALRRARKLAAPVYNLTAAQWREIKAAYGHRCVYCQRKMKHLTQDHIIPLSKGGQHTASNVVPACRSCNAKKGAGAPLVPVQPLLLTIA